MHKKFAIEYFGQFLQTVRLRTPAVMQADTRFDVFKNIAYPFERYLYLTRLDF